MKTIFHYNIILATRFKGHLNFTVNILHMHAKNGMCKIVLDIDLVILHYDINFVIFLYNVQFGGNSLELFNDNGAVHTSIDKYYII